MSQQLIARARVPDYIQKKHGVRYSARYLSTLASQGEGPRYCRVGKFAFYDPKDLDRWIAERTTPTFNRASEILLAK